MSVPVTAAKSQPPEQRAQPTRTRMLTGPIIVALVAGLVITLTQLWLNVTGAAISATPHEVPIAVIGSQQAVQNLALQLGRSDDFTVVVANNEASAVRLVNERVADGVVNLDKHSVQTADAASIPAAQALEQRFPSRLGFRVSDIKPLPAHDPNGLGLLFIAIAFGLGGLPTGLIFAFSNGRRPASRGAAGRWALLVIVYAGLVSLAVTAVAVSLLNYSSSQFFTIWAWGALLTAAAMATGIVLVALLGLPGAPLGLLVILFFGVPSSPIPVQPWDYASGPYRVLGPYDPVAASVDGMRNGLYFADPPVARNVLVLLAWIVIPMLALLVMGWRSERLTAERVEPSMAPMVAAPAA